MVVPDPGHGREATGEIRRFVAAGGSYLGICGGAGMATREASGFGEIRDLRRELFGSAMSHGGAFRHLIDVVDRLWFRLIRDVDRR